MELDRRYQIAINKKIQSLRFAVEATGRRLSRGYDWRQFVQLRQRFPDQKVHPAFNPAPGLEPGPGEFLWIGIWEDEQLVGIVASRKFDGPMSDLLDTRKLWGLGPDFLDIEPFPLPTNSQIPEMTGRITLQGGAVLADNLRGTGLWVPFGNLIRFVSFRYWREDWQIALHLASTDRTGKRFASFGYASGREPLFDRPITVGPDPTHTMEYIAWASQPDILASLDAFDEKVEPLRLATG